MLKRTTTAYTKRSKATAERSTVPTKCSSPTVYNSMATMNDEEGEGTTVAATPPLVDSLQSATSDLAEQQNGRAATNNDEIWTAGGDDDGGGCTDGAICSVSADIGAGRPGH